MTIIPIIGLMYLAFIGVAVWLSLRMMMASPMSFDDNAFRLFESWSFTRGHTWKMLGLLLVQILIVVVVYLVVIAVAVGVAYASGFRPESWQALAPQQRPGAMPALPPGWQAQAMAIAAIGSLVLAVIGGFMYAIFMAPWVEAYRQLRDSGAGGTAPYSPALGEARPLS
jgi:hypothetical protein